MKTGKKFNSAKWTRNWTTHKESLGKYNKYKEDLVLSKTYTNRMGLLNRPEDTTIERTNIDVVRRNALPPTDHT